jgi:hypothetical protein
MSLGFIFSKKNINYIISEKFEHNGYTIIKIVKNNGGKRISTMFRFGLYSKKWTAKQILYVYSMKSGKTCSEVNNCNIK